MSNCSVLWRRTLRLRSSARWQGIVQMERRAEQYQRELARERDRLRLVLEINNHVAKLDINDVLRSASASIRSYFASDFATFWVLNEEIGQLQKRVARFSWREGIAG